MATIHREGNVELLNGKVAVIGYGSQGHAHALNLHDSGVDVVVGLREGSSSAGRGRGGRPRRSRTIAEAVKRRAARRGARSPTTCSRASGTQEIAPNLEPGAAVLFAHGLNVHFGRIEPPAGHDVDHGRAEGARATASASSSRRAPARPVSSRSRRTRAARRCSSRSPTAPRSAAGASACSRRRSRRRPRATSSASRPSSAAA